MVDGLLDLLGLCPIGGPIWHDENGVGLAVLHQGGFGEKGFGPIDLAPGRVFSMGKGQGMGRHGIDSRENSEIS